MSREILEKEREKRMNKRQKPTTATTTKQTWLLLT